MGGLELNAYWYDESSKQCWWKDEKPKQYEMEKLEVTVDSGAAVSVLPKDACKDYKAEATQQSKDGVQYKTAGGELIRDEGRKTPKVLTGTGQLKQMSFSVGAVHKPLSAVSDICRKGNRVVFDDDGSYVQNKTTGDWTPIRRKKGVYVMTVWVMPSNGRKSNATLDTVEEENEADLEEDKDGNAKDGWAVVAYKRGRRCRWSGNDWQV